IGEAEPAGVAPERDERVDDALRTDRSAAGRVIVNPISGERIVIRQSGAQTNGQLLAFDLYLPPGGHVPAGHAHPIQEERFTVVAGTMRFRLGRRTVLAQPGETIVIPPGIAHWFGNAGAVPSQARVEVRPALRMQELFETTEALGQAAHGAGAALARLANLARVVLEFQREVAVPHVPAPLVRALLAPLARLGQLGRRRSGDTTGGKGAGTL
ncbi:MAG TPA: cupin domain-containing protein, partial [Ktedonobacterales bacterium]